MKFLRDKFKAGFTIVELIVVGAIFAVSVGAFFGGATLSFKAVSKASNKIQAAFLMEEGLEGVRHLRDLSFDHYLLEEELGYERCLYFDDVSSTQKYNFATSTAEVVSRWHLDEPALATSMLDSSTSTNTGTCIGSACPTMGVIGVTVNNITNYNTAAQFDGIDDAVTTTRTPANLGLPTASGVTIEAWAYPTQHPTVVNAGKGVVMSSAGGGFYLFQQGGLKTNCPTAACKVTFIVPFQGSGAPSVGSTISVDIAKFPLNVWSHLVGTYDVASKTMKFYINGKEEGSYNVNPAWTYDWRNQFYIGSNTSAQWFFKGNIDEVSIYNRALTADEVRDRYNGHAICRKPALTDADGTSFTRTVKFENVCRDENGDIVPPATTLTTADASCPGGIVDTQTKKATVNVIWGPNRDSIENVEMYIANLFLN